MGQTQFPNNGAGFGGGRNVCHQVGVDSVRSLDFTPVDGETDSPLLLPVDPPYTPVAPPPQSVMVSLVTHYTIAFWKTFLDGDHATCAISRRLRQRPRVPHAGYDRQVA